MLVEEVSAIKTITTSGKGSSFFWEKQFFLFLSFNFFIRIFTSSRSYRHKTWTHRPYALHAYIQEEKKWTRNEFCVKNEFSSVLYSHTIHKTDFKIMAQWLWVEMVQNKKLTFPPFSEHQSKEFPESFHGVSWELEPNFMDFRSESQGIFDKCATGCRWLLLL